MITGRAISPNLNTMTFGTRNPRVADADGRFSVIFAPEVLPFRRGSALVQGRLPRNKFSLPSLRRIPRRKFLFRQKIFLADSASEAIGSIGPTQTQADSIGVRRGIVLPPRLPDFCSLCLELGPFCPNVCPCFNK